MKYLLKIFIVLLFLFTISTDAQQIVKKDTISGTPLVMSMDKSINDLLTSAEDNCTRNNSGKSWGEDSEKTSVPKVSIPEKALTNVEICRKNPRIMGYKIQLAVVKSNEEAREVGMFFRRRFPNMKVEIDASLRPNYKVMAGSYFTKESAAPDLKRIREFFKDALSVQYRIFCVEAK